MNENQTKFDPPLAVRILLRVLVLICLLLFAVDFVVHRHVSHPLEALPGFYPLYGFIGCVLLVVFAKWLRKLIMRSEDYYAVEKQKLADKYQAVEERSQDDSA